MNGFYQITVQIAYIECSRRTKHHVEGFWTDIAVAYDLLPPQFCPAISTSYFSIFAFGLNYNPFRIILLRTKANVGNTMFTRFVNDALFGRISEQSPKNVRCKWSIKANLTCNGAGTSLVQIFFKRHLS